MGDTKQNAAQKAFEFADKLHMFFPKGLKSPVGENDKLRAGTYYLNDTLLDCLGKEKYLTLCHALRRVYAEKTTHFKADPFFKEGFAKDTVADENILFDNQVLLYWKLSEIVVEVKKLL